MERTCNDEVSDTGSDNSSCGSSSCGSSSSSRRRTSTSTSSSGTDENDNNNDEKEEDEKLQPQQNTITNCTTTTTDEDIYARQVRLWTERIPIGLGLCPWAMKSQRYHRLFYKTCSASQPSDVMDTIRYEASVLCQIENEVTPLCSTLVVCPFVTEWNDNFSKFDNFVTGIENSKQKQQQQQQQENADDEDALQHITMVAFHPKFLRWRDLPSSVGIGTVVQSYRGMPGIYKTCTATDGTILETTTRMFGRRKVKIRFHNDQKEQYVPIDWLVFPQQQFCTHNSTSSNSHVNNDDASNTTTTTTTTTNTFTNGLGPPLPDNAMHQAPFPTIHLIQNSDLSTLCVRDVSRVKRKNAQKMMKLGWMGILQQQDSKK